MGFFSAIGDFFTGKKARSESETQGSSTTVANPWAPAIPYLTDYLGQVNDTFANTPQISPFEQQGFDMLKATAESGGVQPAIDANARTMAGDYLTPDTNPYLADIASRVAGTTMANINSTFGGSGRTGSGLHAIYAGQGVGNALTDLYGENFARERGYQEQAISRAPMLDAARYLPAEAMISAGESISARPFDLLAAQGGILANIAGLGGTTQTDAFEKSRSKGNAEKAGAFGTFGNKLLFGN